MQFRCTLYKKVLNAAHPPQRVGLAGKVYGDKHGVLAALRTGFVHLCIFVLLVFRFCDLTVLISIMLDGHGSACLPLLHVASSTQFGITICDI